MAATGAFINAADLDGFNNVWTVGRDLNKFQGSTSTYLNFTNSAVPSNFPYYLDTRSISINKETDEKWVGCAYSTTFPSTPLVFMVQGPYAATGSSWSPFQITGATGGDLEVPTIFASPYGDQVLAFISPLNGGAGTGPAGVYGVTGGDLYVYNRILETWTNLSPNFTWPHIYDIKAKGIFGSTFEYYLATSTGVWIIPDGILDVSELDGGSKFITQAKIWNSQNTPLPSNVVYSLDFDENGNLWIGTDSGLVYWDQEKFYVWNSSNLTTLGNNSITFVKARPNGHVFFSAGNADKNQGTGLYYFNGDNLVNYTTTNSGLPSNDIVSIMLAPEKSSSGSMTVYPNDIFFVAGNSVGLFDYTIPHIYATSKFTGTTGWNFVYYTPTTTALETDEARLPKANKYSWDYPSWRNYQDFNLAYKHPGLDPRNLFLEANFKAIADGRAGDQDYWNLGEIPNSSSLSLVSSLQSTDWVNAATGGVTKVSSVAYLDKKYIAGGYTSLDVTFFGPKNNLEDLVLNNPNPTISGYPRSGQKVGYLAYYNEAGQVQDVLTIRGYETEVWDIQPSTDEKSIYVLGAYKGYIEAGKLLWSSTYPGAGGLTGGPTGGPIGFSNIQTPGITGSPYEYPWIFSGSSSIPATGPYVPSTGPIDPSKQGIFLMEIEKNLGSQSSYGGVNFGATGDFESSYRLKSFRSFPAVSSSFNPDSSSTIIDTTFYEKTLSLGVSNYEVNIVGTLEGGLATYKDQWSRSSDLPSSSDFLFSSWDTGYLKSGFWISLGTELELLKTKVTSGTGGNVIFNSIQKDQGSQTYLITGTSKSDQFNFLGSGITGGSTGATGPFYLIANYNSTISSFNFINTNSAPIDSYQGIDSGFRDGKYYFATFYSGTGSFGGKSISEGFNYPGFSVLTASLTPSESIVNLFTNKILPVDLNVTSFGMEDIDASSDGFRYYSFFSQGGTAFNYIWKTNSLGGLEGSYEIGGTGSIRLGLDSSDSLLIGGYRLGQTGPSEIPINSSSFEQSFTAFTPQYIPGVGIDLGNIISRAGSGSWTWADVHNSNGDLLVPLLSTVFFSNYASQIFGKQNNQWILTDEYTKSEILNVKSIPYFIYTFTETGYYSIQNIVKDSNGNVYSISKKAFIKVVNQSIPAASDPNPEFVNSVDYGYPQVGPLEKEQSFRLGKDLLEDQAGILQGMRKPFGSGLILKNDPNSYLNEN